MALSACLLTGISFFFGNKKNNGQVEGSSGSPPHLSECLL